MRYDRARRECSRMASYKVRIDPRGPLWPEDQPTFKHRRHSSAGLPCAQPVYEARRRAGFAQLIISEEHKGRTARVLEPREDRAPRPRRR
jgi:hypothetical protein